MEFNIQTRIEKYSTWEIIKPHLIGFGMYFCIPFIFANHILKKIGGQKQPELRPTNLWIENKNYNELKIWTYAIDDDEECKNL